MAYISQDDKASLAPAIKAVLKKYGMKGSIGIRHYSTLVVKIQSGAIDFGKDRIEVNWYCIDQTYSGTAREFLNELVAAMMGDKWYDRSDRMADCYEIAFYLSINVGQWDKPYICTAEVVAA